MADSFMLDHHSRTACGSIPAQLQNSHVCGAVHETITASCTTTTTTSFFASASLCQAVCEALDSPRLDLGW